MDDLIKLYWKLRSIARELGDEIAQEFSVAPHEEPAAFYAMAFNGITMAIELLGYYKRVWGNLSSATNSTVEEAREQNSQRVILLEKMTFIEIMSSFEFASKNIVLSNPQKFGAFSGRIYLSGIMKRSLDIGLIGQADLNLWNGAVRLRNSLVHNNGVSEETARYLYPEVTIEVNENTMTRGNLKVFGLLTKWMLNESKMWISGANKKIQPTANATAD
jgi:small nuclear ribonucleoprotein (snRNP)-like protein